MFMRSYCQAAVLCAFASTTPAQQLSAPRSDALVTFYSHAVTVKGGLMGPSLGAFMGRIFEGDHQIAFMEPSRFVTFHLAPGTHVFSAVSWMNKSANHGAHLTLNLEANQHYFVETGTLAVGPPFVIRQVPCGRAALENAHTAPLEFAHLRPDGRSIAVNDVSFPACP